jgi:hypothetical protein
MGDRKAPTPPPSPRDQVRPAPPPAPPPKRLDICPECVKYRTEILALERHIQALSQEIADCLRTRKEDHG